MILQFVQYTCQSTVAKEIRSDWEKLRKSLGTAEDPKEQTKHRKIETSRVIWLGCLVFFLWKSHVIFPLEKFKKDVETSFF